jgi:hypothetical protein
MRCIFTMFAEDVGLLPERIFTDALEQHWIPNPPGFPVQIETLWRAMNEGTAFGFVGKLLRFNGGLFASPTSLPLQKPDLEKLHRAAKHDWSQVEPAIFGTLLERALSNKERHKLGAHYTPRAFVERLVKPTIEEPLRAEWDVVRTQVRTLVEAGKTKDAIAATHGFHHKLVTTRVLDPACGSGNFLYVTLDLFKRLESEVLALLHDLGETQELLETERVTPAQFLGIEVKRWAKEIAELVLWIGYLQWHYRTHGRLRPPPEPVLQNYGNIECRDAVLAWDRIELELDGHAKPRTRWDGESYKRSPVTGEDVPDDAAQVPIERYVNPRKAAWPSADFIVGNPPFLGSKRMRLVLGDGYVEALRATHPDVPESSDLVLYWWDTAATLVGTGGLVRSGLITTNSISQPFGRRIIDRHAATTSLAFAIPDHPWVDSETSAAVRIAMTVLRSGPGRGVLETVASEGRSDADHTNITFDVQRGAIHSNLRIGASLDAAVPLRANEGLASQGVILCGSGFQVSPQEATALGLGTVQGLERHIRPYVNGRDFVGRRRDVMVIDMFGLSESDVRQAFPAAYQWLLERVKPARDSNPRATYRERWWIFCEPRSALRAATAGIPRYCATCLVGKHPIFHLVERDVLADARMVVVAVGDAPSFGVLSSSVHGVWALAAGGRMGVGNDPVYNKTRCFDPFPFPLASELQAARIGSLGERIAAHRKQQQSEHPDLLMTGMYNVLEKLRAGAELTAKERVINEHGLVSLLRQLHDELDAAVFDAYGWPHDLTDEQILERLVTVNAERAEEERNGLIRWLRPEFQNPGGQVAAAQVAIEAVNEGEDAGEEAAASVAPAKALPFPKKLPERIAAVRDLVAGSRGAWTLAQVVAAFGGSKKADVATVLESLSALGIVVAYEAGGERRYRAAARVAA